MRSGTVEVDKALIPYTRTGNGQARLVLLHGLTDDGACWSRVAMALADEFDLLMPDARGHGNSSRIGDDGFTVSRLASDVVGVLDALGMRDAVLFGHSMGAITAAAVAADRPDLVRVLVLEDPPLDIPSVADDVRRAGMLAEVAPWGGLDARARHALARVVHPEWDPVETDAWADAKAALDPAVLDHVDLFDAYDWRGVLDRLERPGLLVTGDVALGAIVTDAVAGEASRLWSSGRVLHVPGAGHCVHRDRWAAAMTPIRSYLLEQIGGLDLA